MNIRGWYIQPKAGGLLPKLIGPDVGCFDVETAYASSPDSCLHSHSNHTAHLVSINFGRRPLTLLYLHLLIFSIIFTYFFAKLQKHQL